MLRYLFLPCLLSIFWRFEQPTKVPDTTVFCGIEITIEEGAKDKIREIKKKLYENPTYFNAAVDRGDTYLPFIEEALKDLDRLLTDAAIDRQSTILQYRTVALAKLGRADEAKESLVKFQGANVPTYLKAYMEIQVHPPCMNI